MQINHKRYNITSLRCMTDESLVILTLETGRSFYDPAVPTELKPTQDEAMSIVSELMRRLTKAEKLAEKLDGEEQLQNMIAHTNSQIEKLQANLRELASTTVRPR